MTYVSSSGSYIRKSENNGGTSTTENVRGDFVEQRVWELLRTPHTIESLQQAIARDDQGKQEIIAREGIKDALERLLEADAIELSPDS